MTAPAWTLAIDAGLDVSVADQGWVLAYVALATGLGAVVGAERELANKAAGIRTHMLVAAGSALVLAVSHHLVERSGTGDPTRVLHGVITGLGFLGAGAIIRRGDATVEGLTTAASLWFTGAIGAVAGLGLWVAAAGATALAVIVLRVVGWAESRWPPTADDPPDDRSG